MVSGIVLGGCTDNQADDAVPTPAAAARSAAAGVGVRDVWAAESIELDFETPLTPYLPYINWRLPGPTEAELAEARERNDNAGGVRADQPGHGGQRPTQAGNCQSARNSAGVMMNGSFG